MISEFRSGDLRQPQRRDLAGRAEHQLGLQAQADAHLVTRLVGQPHDLQRDVGRVRCGAVVVAHDRLVDLGQMPRHEQAVPHLGVGVVEHLADELRGDGAGVLWLARHLVEHAQQEQLADVVDERADEHHLAMLREARLAGNPVGGECAGRGVMPQLAHQARDLGVMSAVAALLGGQEHQVDDPLQAQPEDGRADARDL